MFHGHVGAMDVCARALLIAEKMILDGRVAHPVTDRYAGWQASLAKACWPAKPHSTPSPPAP